MEFIMKKSVFTSIALLSLALVACSNNQTAENQTSTSEEKVTIAPTEQTKSYHYVVGINSTMPPFVFKDEHGNATGFDIDILKAIGDNQDFSLDFVHTERSELFNELQAGKYQILAANLGINPERLAQSEMSNPYVWAPNVIMGKEGSTAKTLADLSNSSVGVQEGSYSEQVLKKAGIKNIVPKVSLFAAYVDLIQDKVDYVVGDAGALSHHHLAHKDSHHIPLYTIIYDKDEDVRVGFAVQKGNIELINKINTGLQAIQQNGTYDTIYKKWFGDDNSLRVPADKI